MHKKIAKQTHNKFLEKYNWYSTWHDNRYHRKIHAGILTTYSTIVLLILLVSFKGVMALSDLITTWDFSNPSEYSYDAVVKALGFNSSKDALGQKINLLVPLQNAEAKKDKIENEFEIVGVIDSGNGNEVYVPSFHFDIAGVPAFSQARLLTDNVDNIPILRNSIESMGFQTASPSDTIDQVKQIFTIFNFVMIGFGSIGMLIAVLGMFNTLTISLLERTKEIGLMMALGGRNKDMNKLFMVESLLLSIFGAFTGILLAIITGRVINIILLQFAHHRGVTGSFQVFAVPLWLILSMVAFMAFVGLVVAFLPAQRARRISPIDALRRE